MVVKILCGIVAVALMVSYIGVPVIKLKEIPLAIVGLICIVMMLWDLWDSLKEPED
jgi:hypothetical protein